MSKTITLDMSDAVAIYTQLKMRINEMHSYAEDTAQIQKLADVVWDTLDDDAAYEADDIRYKFELLGLEESN